MHTFQPTAPPVLDSSTTKGHRDPSWKTRCPFVVTLAQYDLCGKNRLYIPPSYYVPSKKMVNDSRRNGRMRIIHWTLLLSQVQAEARWDETQA